jgi:hypothetical protein
MYSEQDEIDDLNLRKFGVRGGFTVPPQYFDRLRGHILEQTTGLEESLPHAGVPDGYFERSRAAILAKTSGAAPVKPLQVWYNKPLYRYAAAAVAVFTLSVIFWLPRHSTTTAAAAAAISDEDILHYLETSDLRDITIYEAGFNAVAPSNIEVEQYIIDHSNEQLLEEL